MSTKPFTTIEFIFMKNGIITTKLDKEREKLKVSLNSESTENIKEKEKSEITKIKMHDLAISNIIELYFSFIEDENINSYIEYFSMYDEDNICPESFYEFQHVIYFNKKNLVCFDLDEKEVKNCPSFELLFYAKSEEFLPKTIKYKNYELSNFENNNNKLRKRIFLANILPEKLEIIQDKKLKDYNFLDQSYHILIRISDENNLDYSLCEMEDFSFNEKKNQKIEIKFEDNEINMLKEFSKDYSSFLKILNKTHKSKNSKEIKEKFHELTSKFRKIILTQNYLYFLKPDKYKDISNGLELFFLYSDISEFECIDRIQNNKDKSYNFYNNIVDINNNRRIKKLFYEELENDNKLSNLSKIKIFQTLIIFLNKSEKNLINASYVNIENENENNPYFKAINLLIDIISKLDENSRLFEAFLYFDSGVIFNFLEKEKNENFKYKDVFGHSINYTYGEYQSEYGINLLNTNEIKRHLLNLLPKYIIRAESKTKYRAYYESETNIMIINEKEMFGQSIYALDEIYSEDPNSYVIPIAMEILHEMLAHGKVRLNDKYIRSPTVYKDKKYNFQSNSIKKNINNKDYPIGESGKVLEHYISEKSEIIKNLKKPNKKNEILIDSSYWIGENFEKLEEIVSNNKFENTDINGNDENLDEIEEEDNLSDDCYVSYPD